MDDIQVGKVIRAVRSRRHVTQAELAELANVSPAFVSLIERGHLRQASVGAIRAVADVLEIQLRFAPRWRGPELATLLDETHSKLVAATLQGLRNHDWPGRTELTFNKWGEHGSIDVVGVLETRLAAAIVECKSKIVDTQDLFSTMHRKRRLAPDLIEEEFGWRPTAIASILVLPDTSTARAQVARRQLLFASELPARTVDVRRWLEDPTGNLEAIWFLDCR
jgi:transcriptional regulator with XRE-family HTH domain